MKKLLYIGHSYHNKTKSTLFLKELLAQKYVVETFDFDPYQDTYQKFEALKGRAYDMVVIFQIMPNIKKIKTWLKAKRYVFFPMYDGSGSLGLAFWYQWRDVKIINFSKTLHEKLSDWGLDSFYIQYFPKPVKNPCLGRKKNIYFWQRTKDITAPLVEKLFSHIGYNKIHIHKALDPNETFIPPSQKMHKKAVYSTWYQDKEAMQKEMNTCGIYIAPRLYEGIGMSFLEAMAMGKCVIAPDHPTMNEYIRHNKTGILYNFEAVEALAPFNAHRLGLNAYHFIKKGFKRFEREKINILKEMEKPIKIDKKKLLKPSFKFSLKLFDVLPLFQVEKNFLNKKIKLFGVTFLLIQNDLKG